MTDDVVLRQNLPTKVEGSRLIAYNIAPESAVLSNDGARSMIHPDDVVTVAGLAYAVHELAPHDDARPEHRPNGWVRLRQVRP